MEICKLNATVSNHGRLDAELFSLLLQSLEYKGEAWISLFKLNLLKSESIRAS